MPYAPKAACPVCRRVGCTQHRIEANRRRTPRPMTNAEIVRRKAAVDEWRAQYGDWCPACGWVGVKLTADHVVPVALGGDEDGELRVMCKSCNSRGGAAITNRR